MTTYEFATDQELKDAYCTGTTVIGMYAEVDDEAKTVGLTGSSLRVIAPQHVEALRIGGSLAITFFMDDASLAFKWSSQAPEDPFIGQELMITPDEPAKDEWSQYRRRYLAPSLGDLPGYSVESIFGPELEGQLGTGKMFKHEAVALRGIMEAIISVGPGQVQTCHPDQIG